jgi:hypothetical protein
MSDKEKRPEIDNIGVVVTLKGSDRVHQIPINDKTKNVILQVIMQLEGVINVLETPIEGIKIERNEKKYGRK